MRKFSITKRLQAGFTLIELIVVIVIIGILAAVALPKLAGLTDEANKAKNTAVLGALKSAWTFAYAQQSGGNPTGAQVANEMSDPTCSSSASSPYTITCGPLTGGVASNTYAVGGVATTFIYTQTTPPTPTIVCSPANHCK